MTTAHASRKSDDRRVVMLVDDNRDIRGALARHFEVAGWRVLTAGDGLSALQLFEVWCPDAVVSDLHMPGAPAVTLLETVKRVCPNTRCVLLSGWPTSEARERVNALGFHVLTKPCDFDDIIAAVTDGRKA